MEIMKSLVKNLLIILFLLISFLSFQKNGSDYNFQSINYIQNNHQKVFVVSNNFLGDTILTGNFNNGLNPQGNIPAAANIALGNSGLNTDSLLQNFYTFDKTLSNPNTEILIRAP